MRTSAPVIDGSPFVADRRGRLSTRCDGFTVVCTSSSRPGPSAPSRACVGAERDGPQSWYGEIESYGSGTDTRYGTGAEFQTSSIAAVRPPEVEKKYVIATLPL